MGYQKIEDTVLIQEIIRRFLGRQVPGTGVKTYEGASYRNVLDMSLKLMSPEAFHLSIHSMLERKRIVLTGKRFFYSADKKVKELTKGTIAELHPDSPLNSHLYYSKAGTPLSKVTKCNTYSIWIDSVYLTENYLPKSKEKLLEKEPIFPLVT